MSGKFDVHRRGRPATSMFHGCVSDSRRDVGEKPRSTINYWNMFLYRRPILPAASAAGGLSIAFFDRSSEYQTSLFSTRYDSRRLRTCTRSVTTYENLKVPFSYYYRVYNCCQLSVLNIYSLRWFTYIIDFQWPLYIGACS